MSIFYENHSFSLSLSLLTRVLHFPSDGYACNSPSDVKSSFSVALQFRVCSVTVCTQTRPHPALLSDYPAEEGK